MRKETCTYNELAEFLMVSGFGKRTGHTTLKNAKEKASLPKIPHKCSCTKLHNYGKTALGHFYDYGYNS